MNTSFESDMTEMLILHVTAAGAACGYDISQQVLERSQGHFTLREGELYPVLHRMERQGLLHTYWTQLTAERRRKFYKITAEGQMLLESRREQWRQFSVGVNGVIGAPQWNRLLGRLEIIMSTWSIRRGESALSKGI